MKRELKMITAAIIALYSVGAFADMSSSKPQTRIDFNKLIDESSADKKDLHQDMKQADGENASATKKDKDNVIDFIDVEVGIGHSPNLVDRRFDSVGEAKVVTVKNPGSM